LSDYVYDLKGKTFSSIYNDLKEKYLPLVNGNLDHYYRLAQFKNLFSQPIITNDFVHHLAEVNKNNDMFDDFDFIQDDKPEDGDEEDDNEYDEDPKIAVKRAFNMDSTFMHNRYDHLKKQRSVDNIISFLFKGFSGNPIDHKGNSRMAEFIDDDFNYVIRKPDVPALSWKIQTRRYYPYGVRSYKEFFSLVLCIPILLIYCFFFQ